MSFSWQGIRNINLQTFTFSRWLVITVIIAMWRGENEKRLDADDKILCILEPELIDKAFRRNWARLIQKIYETDPLTCPKCNDQMAVIAFIEDSDVIKPNH